MAHIVKTVKTAWPPEAAFAYMADFSHTVEWDPGVVAASRKDDGAIGLGSVFDLTVRMGGRRLPLRYEVTDFAPGRVTFTARSATLESVDTVTVAPRGASTEVTYDACIHFRSLLRLADPLLALGFRGVADRAIRGLERRLSEAA
jgi:hypothetical protein